MEADTAAIESASEIFVNSKGYVGLNYIKRILAIKLGGNAEVQPFVPLGMEGFFNLNMKL